MHRTSIFPRLLASGLVVGALCILFLPGVVYAQDNAGYPNPADGAYVKFDNDDDDETEYAG